ncbi:DUF7314 family protein [Halobaculum lipolyticum]|uniref:DUF7314 domain-containing protein n=1 Tax=Halobaculum lipolyticum TaxID=3032001 RepID=A0ABD5WCS5_9EURY|nr:hypothetical protein [Halobaculum sp. DT31]
MADEFIKGLGLFSGAGLAWMVLAGWYRTESFESSRQLIAAPPEPNTVFDAVGIFLNDVFFWTAIVGALTFWVLIPALRQVRDSTSPA